MTGFLDVQADTLQKRHRPSAGTGACLAAMPAAMLQPGMWLTPELLCAGMLSSGTSGVSALRNRNRRVGLPQHTAAVTVIAEQLTVLSKPACSICL